MLARRVVRWKLLVCAAVCVGSMPARGDVDLNGPWRVIAQTAPYLNPDVNCIVDVVQLGSSFSALGNACSLPINLSGTINPTTGAFSASGASDPFLCPTLSISGNASPAGDGFDGTFSCNGVIPVSGPFTGGLCANGVVDASEDCDDANLSYSDCCSPTCEFDPPNYTCLGPDQACNKRKCDGAGTCVAKPGPAGVRCDSDFNGCTDDVCDAAGNCTHPDSPAGTACTIDFDVCTDDTCDGNGQCVTAPNTAPCDDFNTCTIGDTCSAGTCIPGATFSPAGIRCDTDSDSCTVDECDGAGGCANVGCSLCCGGFGCSPNLSAPCSVGSDAKVQMKRRHGDPDRDRLTFKWTGPATTAEFGAPTSITSYELCLYETEGSPQQSLRFQARAAAGEVCGDRPCWKNTGTGFAYKDGALDPDGLQQVRVKASGGNGAIKVKGKGANIGWYRFDSMFQAPLAAQLRASNGECWGTVFDSFDKHGPERLRATSGD